MSPCQAKQRPNKLRAWTSREEGMHLARLRRAHRWRPMSQTQSPGGPGSGRAPRDIIRARIRCPVATRQGRLRKGSSALRNVPPARDPEAGRRGRPHKPSSRRSGPDVGRKEFSVALHAASLAKNGAGRRTLGPEIGLTVPFQIRVLPRGEKNFRPGDTRAF